MKDFCLDLREHEKNELIQLTKEENKIHRKQKSLLYMQKII